MTLQKAIEIKQLALDTGIIDDPDDFRAADKLSIEALTRLHKMRHGAPEPTYYLLPGETKE